MSYIFDPMTLGQMLLWLKQLSHKDVYKINSIIQECPSLMRNYYITKKEINKMNEKTKLTKQKTPHILTALRTMENGRGKN